MLPDDPEGAASSSLREQAAAPSPTASRPSPTPRRRPASAPRRRQPPRSRRPAAKPSDAGSHPTSVAMGIGARRAGRLHKAPGACSRRRASARSMIDVCMVRDVAGRRPQSSVTSTSTATRLREECGVFGIFGHPDAAAITALGLHALQHRGQEAAGIVSFDGRRFHSERAPRPRRRQLLRPRDHRAAAGPRRHRPCPLLDHRRDHPAQRPAALRRTRRRRLRGCPQRQPDQRPDAAPRARRATARSASRPPTPR